MKKSNLWVQYGIVVLVLAVFTVIVCTIRAMNDHYHFY